jgi:DNA-binding PadR family transcriptional regulator
MDVVKLTPARLRVLTALDDDWRDHPTIAKRISGGMWYREHHGTLRALVAAGLVEHERRTDRFGHTVGHWRITPKGRG